MTRGRPPLPVGSHGEITFSEEPRSTQRKPVWKARTRFRRGDGRTVLVARYGQTKAEARRRLEEACAVAAQQAAAEGIGAATTLQRLAEEWVARNSPEWSIKTRDTYGYVVAKHVIPRMGGLRVSEVSTSTVHRVLAKVRDDDGPSAAKTARSVLSGMFRLAVQEGAVNANPVLGSIRLPSTPQKGKVRALTREQTDELCDWLRSDARALELDLPDLVEWMLATGARIGEAIAARDALNSDGEPVLDLAAGTWEINATVVREKGKGLVIQPRTKTAAGWRVLALPSFAVEMARRRQSELRFGRPHGVLFGAPKANALRDPSNTAGDLREVLDRAGFDWVTSHVFRKTVATRLDEADWSGRQIADQLGHARPSMTVDVYLGRNVVGAEAARILDR